MKQFITIAVVALSLGSILLHTYLEEEKPAEYIDRIAKIRQERDRFMNESDQSPFVGTEEIGIELNYYPINIDYKVKAKVEVINGRSYVSVTYSDGSVQKYRRYAWLYFSIGLDDCKLLVLKDPKTNTLFTAFTDSTSTNETYGGGRYIDLDFKKAARIELDFNQAYNPYCSYNDEYLCPLPYCKNVLKVAVEAGEKLYENNK